MVNNAFSKDQKLNLKNDFRGHILTPRAENTPKSSPFKKRMLEQLLNNPKATLKMTKNDLYALKIDKLGAPILAKLSIFMCILDLNS